MTLIRERSKKFFNTTRDCDDIASRIEECNAQVSIKLVKIKQLPNGNWVNAYVRFKERDIISYNELRMKRSVEAMTNTLVHEAIHVIDYFHDKNSIADFTHNGNKPSSRNADAAPNWIGNRAQDLVPMLNDHEGNDDAKGFGAASMDEVRGYVTDRDWYGEESSVCPTDDETVPEIETE